MAHMPMCFSERDSAWADWGKLRFPSRVCEAGQFQGQISSTVRLCSISAEKLESLRMSVNVYSDDHICSPILQNAGLYMGIL